MTLYDVHVLASQPILSCWCGYHLWPSIDPNFKHKTLYWQYLCATGIQYAKGADMCWLVAIAPSLSLETCLPTSWPVIAAFMRPLWIHRFHRNGKQLVIQMESSMAFNQPQLPRDVPWYIHGSFHHGMWSEFLRPYPFVEVGGSSCFPFKRHLNWGDPQVLTQTHTHTHMTFVWRWGTSKWY